MKMLFHIGPIPVYFFGLMVALGLILAVAVAFRAAKRRTLNPEIVIDIAIGSLVFGVLGARIFYILVYNFSYYVQNPVAVFMINEGGLSIHGGILGGALFTLIYLRYKKLPVWKYADVLAPALILGQGVARVGCDVLGKVMATPYFWGVRLGTAVVHPAQVYEFTLDFLLFFILRRKMNSQKYDGQIFSWYLICFSIIRGFVEFFRTNPMVIPPFSVAHLSSLVMLATGIVLGFKLKQKAQLSEIDNQQHYTIAKTSVLKDLLITLLLLSASLFIFYTIQ